MSDVVAEVAASTQLRPTRRRLRWWIVAVLVVATALAAAVWTSLSSRNDDPWVVWAHVAAVQRQTEEYVLYENADVRLAPDGPRDDGHWTPGGQPNGRAANAWTCSLWRAEREGPLPRFLRDLLGRRTGTRVYESIDAREIPADAVTWDAFVLSPFPREIRAARADPRCVGEWDVADDADRWVVRWKLAADGTVADPAEGATDSAWGVRDGVLAMWTSAPAGTTRHVVGLLDADGASFVGIGRAGAAPWRKLDRVRGRRVGR